MSRGAGQGEKVLWIGGNDGVAVAGKENEGRINDIAFLRACQEFAGIFPEFLVKGTNLDAGEGKREACRTRAAASPRR